jgi:hypothetical protein
MGQAFKMAHGSSKSRTVGCKLRRSTRARGSARRRRRGRGLGRDQSRSRRADSIVGRPVAGARVPPAIHACAAVRSARGAAVYGGVLAIRPVALVVSACVRGRDARLRESFAARHVHRVRHAVAVAVLRDALCLEFHLSHRSVVYAPVARASRRGVAHASRRFRASRSRLGRRVCRVRPLQHARASMAAEALAASRGHTPASVVVTPGLFSVLLWKSIYEDDGTFYVDAVRAGLSPTPLPGETIAKLDVARDFPWLEPSSQQARDVARFARVANGFVAVDKAATQRVIDLRYSLVPNEIAGFWAIVLDPSASSVEHVDYVTTRERAPEQFRGASSLCSWTRLGSPSTGGTEPVSYRETTALLPDRTAPTRSRRWGDTASAARQQRCDEIHGIGQLEPTDWLYSGYW